jgi:diketogulonate reductase-like aldo/keto reductase
VAGTEVTSIPTKQLRSGLSLPVLGLGTWLMGGDAMRTDTPQDALDVRAIEGAVEMGYSHIDTAEIYGAGHTEELVGQALKSVDRSKVFLASKAKQGNHTPQLLASALEASLRRLGTDYLDLYYLHRYTPNTPLEETAEGLNALHAAGKIKHVGVCNFSAAHLDELQHYLKPRIIANQVHYNLAFREPERTGMLTHAIEKDYFVIAWRPLRLAKRNADAPPVEHNVWESGAFPTIETLAKKYGKTNVQIALAWTTQQPNVLTLVKSSRTVAQQEAAAAFDFKLSPEDYTALSRDFTPQYPVSDTIPLE